MNAFLIAGILFSPFLYASAENLETVEIEGASRAEVITASKVSDLLKDFSHISNRENGGIADTPSIHGLASDRVNIQIDGSSMTNSCPNHMNPTLSFVHPDQVVAIESFAGLDPVSNGGDNIAGTILIKTKNYQFTKNEIDSSLRLRTYYRSNNFQSGVALGGRVSSPDYAFSYEGLQERAGRYLDGNGKRVKGTLFEQNNQAVTLAKKINRGDVAVKFSRSNIPYQGFVNQYMDLVSNQVDKAQLSLNKEWAKIKLEFISSLTHTDHSMNKITSERLGNMPMATLSDEFNTSLKFNYGTAVNFGLEYFHYRLDDYWNPVDRATMMSPRKFLSIFNGKRKRVGAYLEKTFYQGERMEILSGLRSDVVMMDTDKVSGYNDTNNAPLDATYFNSQNRSQTDVNFDALLALRFKASDRELIETGYARKTRSPNMYERYSWAGIMSPQGMDMRMINWFGDGNGYVGDVDLKPEVAHKLSLKYSYNNKSSLKFEITPFFHYVENFIDADILRQVGGIHYLQFVNEDAVLYGADLNASLLLFSSSQAGDFSLGSFASYTRGYRVDKKADLYHLMPLNLNLSLKHHLSWWENELALKMVSQKNTVNKLRLEASTPGHAVLDFATRLKWSHFTWELGVSNILDKDYQMPLAGVDVVNYSAASKTAQFAMGRSYNTNLVVEF